MMGVLTELYEATIMPDKYGALPLHYAAKAGIYEIVEMLYYRCIHNPLTSTLTLHIVDLIIVSVKGTPMQCTNLITMAGCPCITLPHLQIQRL